MTKIDAADPRVQATVLKAIEETWLPNYCYPEGEVELADLIVEALAKLQAEITEKDALAEEARFAPL